MVRFHAPADDQRSRMAATAVLTHGVRAKPLFLSSWLQGSFNT